ncbi:MAG: inositol 2-dehydrogenase [Pseudogulbenkiania sp.]|nr:inositol 2-dehydrogenase [Pseudogulbenkiania sp.]
MLRFALFGAGRIGRLHAENVSANPDARLVCVYDVNGTAASEVAQKYGAEVAPTVDAALANPEVDAVLIASSTNTHVDLITRSAQAGKAVLCEKPIDLDIAQVNRCREAIAGCNVPVQIGFNRRYDPNHRGVFEAVKKGEIGQLEQLVITSRDPSPPPASYVAVSGGLFRDMMIHDFDLARFILGEEIVEVTASGSVLVDPAIGEAGDIDSAMVVMKTASGKLCHINNSRRASYGYDQRVEAFGSLGMVISNNRTATTVERYSASATGVREPLLNFFIDRYGDAYRNQINDFIDAVRNNRAPSPGFDDGRRALLLADAALESLRSGRTVQLND